MRGAGVTVLAGAMALTAVTRALGAQQAELAGTRTAPHPIPAEPPIVRTYRAPRADAPPRVDGLLDDAAWHAAPWSEAFVDIEGPRRPDPPLTTRFRLLWDDRHLFVGAMLEEPDLWATLGRRDTVIFLDNDFELFLDPDGDTHEYLEIEINARATVWDLLLDRPYRDGGKAHTSWDVAGLEAAVHVHGTLNDPSDRDCSWSVELAIPWTALGRQAPRDGEQWRVNFSRVQWALDTAGGGYHKRADPATGHPLPEANWAWSPQYAVNMHLPELWGVVRFDAVPRPAAPVPDGARERWLLRRVYYAQRAYYRRAGRYAARVADLDVAAGLSDVTISASDGGYVASLAASERGTWHLTADGRVWRDP